MFLPRMAAFVSDIKAVPLAQGCEDVCDPGEIADNNEARFRREGLALPEDTRADLRRIAQATGFTVQGPC
jgi:LDH2 family malate/lactate/ureidoglycolate dehydrogenase